MEVFFQGAKQLILRRPAFWTSALSVPRIPILASLRRVPHLRKSLTRQKALCVVRLIDGNSVPFRPLVELRCSKHPCVEHSTNNTRERDILFPAGSCTLRPILLLRFESVINSQHNLALSVANVHPPRTLGLSKRSMSTLHVGCDQEVQN